MLVFCRHWGPIILQNFFFLKEIKKEMVIFAQSVIKVESELSSRRHFFFSWMATMKM